MVCEHKYMNIRPRPNYRAGGATGCLHAGSHELLLLLLLLKLMVSPKRVFQNPFTKLFHKNYNFKIFTISAKLKIKIYVYWEIILIHVSWCILITAWLSCVTCLKVEIWGFGPSDMGLIDNRFPTSEGPNHI